MNSKKWAWGVGRVVCLLLLAACSGTRLNEVGEVNSKGEAGSGPSGAEKPKVEDAASAQAMLPEPRDAKALCGVPGDLMPPPTVETIGALLVGQWLYCSGDRALGSEQPGIEFTKDGHFYFLIETAEGQLERSKGFDGEGTWGITNNGYDDVGPQVDLTLPAGKGNGGYFRFAKNPFSMRMSLSVVGPGDYVATRQAAAN